ncbi:EscU/YscU/HrcU family type III secretion system export apparatus switch protein, partial [Pseudomonas sp.]|uniref:EscU/YscU/HrcU family type III secretion system export apparatus switch protein n=1 Tax=Pseudomonas sp. TaxID=306 RepID=UPI003563F2F3
MAESESGADKSEEPTEKRLRESREKGQIARSRELNTLAIMLAGTGGLLAFGGSLGSALISIMSSNFSLPREVIMDERSMAIGLLASGKVAVDAMLPLFLALLIASIVGPIALGGWLFSAKAMAPKISRMDPLAGLKRMFSAKALVELLKALAKFTLVLSVALAVLAANVG